MRRRRISALVLMIMLCSAMVSADQTSAFDISSLSSDGRQAHNKLLRAIMFSLGPIGWTEQRSESELALRALLKEKEAMAALKDLLANATRAGKMYALIGLHVKDKETFKQEAKRYKQGQKTDQNVAVQLGCIIMPEPEKDVIEKIESGQYDLLFK